jgi:hypothetical protein
VDFYVYLTAKKNLDFTYIKSVLEKLSLLKFYENIVKLIDVWFNDANGDEVTDYLTKKIFSEGVYGSEQNSNKSYALRSVESSKNVNGRNFFIAIFPPYASMRDRYPVLKKVKILLPFFWVFRWVSVIFTKPKRISEKVKDIKEMPNVAESYREELNFVGLDYNFDK